MEGEIGISCKWLAAVVLLLTFSARAQNLFEADGRGGTIIEFTPGGTKSTYASGFGYPWGLAFDRADNLFVVDWNGYIYEFNTNGVRSTFASGLYEPAGLAIDRTGNLFVGTENGYIFEFTPGGTESIFASGLGGVEGLAFDSSGNLFAAAGNIYKFTPGGTKSTFASGFGEPDALVFDPSGNLFVVCNTCTNITVIYTNGVVGEFGSGLDCPSAVAFDGAGNLFEADRCSGNICEFTFVTNSSSYGGQSTFASGLVYPSGLAFQAVPALGAASTNGMFQLSVLMPSPYYSTIVQTSTNLVSWVSACTNTPPFTFTDSMMAAYPCRFYRAIVAQ